MKWLDKRKQKVKEYWDNLDLDKQFKIEVIKDYRAKRDFKLAILHFLFVVFIALFFLATSVCSCLMIKLIGGLDEYKKFKDGSYIVYPETVALASVDESLSTAFDDLDPNAVVNFNQLAISPFYHNYNFIYTSGNSRFVFTNYYLNISAGSVLYIKINSSDSNSTLYFDYENGITAVAYSISNDFERLFTTSDVLNDISLAQTNNKTFYNIVVINLSQMFGNNIPTLEECQQLFIADYYSYTSGTPLYFSSFESYANGYTVGFNNAWDSQNVTYRQNVIGSSAFPYNFGTYTESEKIYDNSYSAYMLSGIIGIPLGTVSNGTNISVDFNFLIPDWSGESLSFKQSFNLYFYYLDNSNLVNIGSITYSNIDGNYGTYMGSFVVPITTDTVYMYFSTDPYDFNNGISPTQCFVFDSNMTFRTQDVSAAIQSAFGSGQSSVQQSYAPGTTLYNQIYRSGYNAGLEAENPYTFSALMSSVIEAPLNAVLGLFNFDFMGVNLKNVVTVLFTVAILVAILGLFLGGK